MASAAIKALVSKLPPPGSSGRRDAAPADDDDGNETTATDEYGSDDDKAAETSAAQRVASALGLKDVDADELCSALKDFISTIKE